jgi:hypothetical protein
MTVLTYLDFDLLIERVGDRYRARVLSSPGGTASLDFQLPFTREQLQIFVLKAISLGTRRQVRRIESPDMKEIKAFGRQLFETIFDAEVHDCLRLSLHEAEQGRTGLRIRLRLGDSDDEDDDTSVALSDVPWEFMYDSGGTGFLCLSNASPLVRYQDLRHPIEPVAVKPPLRLLVMISAPRDAPQLNVEHEQAKLDEALRVPIEKGLITIDRMEDATLQQLQRRLRVSEYHAFHFIGHGGYDERGKGGVLLLEDERGRSDPVSAEFLRTLFQNHRTLRLAILNACEGARTDPTDPFAGVAQSLVRGGVTAVIAMQFEISDDAAIILSSEFYSALADGYPVDAALGEARTAVYTRASAVEWAVPVLYLRSPDASIFDIEAPPPPPPIKRKLPPKREPPGGEPPGTEPPGREPSGKEPPGHGEPPFWRRKAILVSAAALVVALAAVFVVSAIIDDPTPPTPTSTPSIEPAASLEGSVVYVHEGDIRAIDPTTGEDRVLLAANATIFAPSVSSDGTEIVFGGESIGGSDVFLVNSDGTGLTNLTDSPGADDSPDWSDDGSRIVFETARDGNFEIYAMDPDGTDLVNLTRDPGDDRLPDWSPDDSRIAFESDRYGSADILVMDADGGNVRRLTGSGSDDGVPVWSPNGRWILYRSDGGGVVDHEAWRMGPLGANSQRVTHDAGDVRAPAWSPDGNRIVYASDSGGDYGLYVIDVEGGERNTLVDSPGDDRGATWCC